MFQSHWRCDTCCNVSGESDIVDETPALYARLYIYIVNCMYLLCICVFFVGVATFMGCKLNIAICCWPANNHKCRAQWDEHKFCNISAVATISLDDSFCTNTAGICHIHSIAMWHNIIISKCVKCFDYKCYNQALWLQYKLKLVLCHHVIANAIDLGSSKYDCAEHIFHSWTITTRKSKLWHFIANSKL